MSFILHAERIGTGERASFHYDPHTSELTDEWGAPIVASHDKQWLPRASFSASQPVIGKHGIKRLKIQLGLSCNFSCSYCLQAAVPRADETARRDVQPFLDAMPTWYDGPADGDGLKIEFWGGEPFAYWKTLRPLAEALRERFPKARFSTITNGSLLDDDKLDWLDRLSFSFAISHDGPGQHVRGPDPLDDPTMRAVWLNAWRRFGHQGRMSFNVTPNAQNPSRQAIDAWFAAIFGDDIVLGEGGYVVAYDAGGLAASIHGAEAGERHARAAFSDARQGHDKHFRITSEKVNAWITSLRERRPSSALGQRCGMERPDSLTVDLKGNVITCQNVSAVSAAQNGNPHKIGHVSDLAAVTLNTATHWRERAGCTHCPVLQLCQGSCMFNDGELFHASCESAYYDNIAFLAEALEHLTGFALTRIEDTTGQLTADRCDPFGLSRTAPLAKPNPKPKRVIPIAVAVAVAN